MKHHLTISKDGSHTLKLDDYDECYHSTNGAFAEACHIYIKEGLGHLLKSLPQNTREVNVIDIGLGTALNCITTLAWQQNLLSQGLTAPAIHYIGIEKYPITSEEAAQLNFPTHIASTLRNSAHNGTIRRLFSEQFPNANTASLPGEKQLSGWFRKIHTSKWEDSVEIAQGFRLTKHLGDITLCKKEDYRSRLYPAAPSVIYYDTFSPATQPQLWAKEIFETIYNAVNPASVLTTYCSKGIVKQAIRESGFTLERLSGPPGKRHILRATKPFTQP